MVRSGVPIMFSIFDSFAVEEALAIVDALHLNVDAVAKLPERGHCTVTMHVLSKRAERTAEVLLARGATVFADETLVQDEWAMEMVRTHAQAKYVELAAKLDELAAAGMLPLPAVVVDVVLEYVYSKELMRSVSTS